MKKSLSILLLLTLAMSGFTQRRNPPPPTRAEELNSRYCSGLFCAIDGTYFDMENDPAAIGAPAYFNILDWLQGRVAGLQVLQFRNVRIPYLRNQPAAIFLDEMRISPDFLNALSVNDIAFIKVMRSPVANFWGAPGGVIAIYTKRGEADEEE
jgi:hypothetical protein